MDRSRAELIETQRPLSINKEMLWRHALASTVKDSLSANNCQKISELKIRTKTPINDSESIISKQPD